MVKSGKNDDKNFAIEQIHLNRGNATRNKTKKK